jgi:hypothetical protein
MLHVRGRVLVEDSEETRVGVLKEINLIGVLEIFGREGAGEPQPLLSIQDLLFFKENEMIILFLFFMSVIDTYQGR